MLLTGVSTDTAKRQPSKRRTGRVVGLEPVVKRLALAPMGHEVRERQRVRLMIESRVRFVLPALSASTLDQLIRKDDAPLGRMLAAHAWSLRAVAVAHGPALAALLNLPLAEVLASPFAFRMCAMGARLGASSVAHESRRVLRPHRSIAVDGDAPGWRDGVLHASKYQQFAADEPRSIYHPEQHAKWAPHELLHRACGYFFRADASRFEIYLGARLNEILPVATWYGIEHCLRLEETSAFDRTVLDRNEATGPVFWLEASKKAVIDRSIAMAPLFREGLLHAQRELAACAHDARTGEVSKVGHAHAFLDAASDALGYVATHTDRLRARSVARVHAMLPGEHDRSLDRYQARIERVLQALLFEPLKIDLGIARRKASVRRGWDRALRSAYLRPEANEAELGALLRGEAPGTPQVRLDGEEHDVAQLDRGLKETLPHTHARSPRLGKRLIASPSYVARAPLGERVARMLEDEADHAGADLARLESALAVTRRADDRVEILEDLDGPPVGRPGVTLSRAFSVLRFGSDPVAALRGDVPSGPSAALVGRFRAETVLMAVERRHAEALREGRVVDLPKDVQRSLAEAGALLITSR